MSIDRDVIRAAVPPILAACVIPLIIGPPPDEPPAPRELVGAVAGGPR